MQDRTDAWTLATRSWWTLSTHAVALSASKSLTATWTSILIKELGRNQDATKTISPVSLFGLTYTCLCTNPQNGAEGEWRIVNHNTPARAVSRRHFTADSMARSYITLLQVSFQSGTGLGVLFFENFVFTCHYHFTHAPYSYFIHPHCPNQCATQMSG